MSSVEAISKPIKKKYLITYLFPIFLLGWVGNSIKFLQVIFSINTRWMLLALVIIFVIGKKHLMRFLNPNLLFFMFIFYGWCFLTTFWSTIPIMSFMKSIMFLIILPTILCLSIEWIKTRAIIKTLDFLWLFAILAVLSAVLGHQKAKEYYAGLIVGANMFGFMMAISFSFFLWKTYQRWEYKIERCIWIFFDVISVYYVFLSSSRVAILIILFVFLGFLRGFNFNKKLKFLFVSILALICVILLNPYLLINAINNLNNTYIHKGGAVDITIFQSRIKPWELSLQGAIEGGWTGLGLGISYGDTNFSLEKGLSTGWYGREKGNSQLAIIEETGLLGIIFYSLLLGFLLFKILKININICDQDDRVLVGILTGMFIGMIIQSIFEAWWDSPGSPENIYFWLLVGILHGLDVAIKNKRKIVHSNKLLSPVSKDSKVF